MKHRTIKEFWFLYKSLPANVQELADKNFELLKLDSRHKSVRLKKVGDYWSARVGLGYRALAIQDKDDLIWFWIGCHAEYDALI